MMHKKLLLLLFLLFTVGVLWIVSRTPSKTSEIKNTLGTSNVFDRPTHPLVFFDKDTFYPGVEQAKSENKAFVAHVSGGIVPHHLFPGFIITDFFSRLSKQKPKTIILIGPNHYERGNYHALSSLYGWETPFGTIEPNEQVIQELVKNKLVKIDENVLPDDQAVAGIMPFIKYYLPNAKVVPVLLSGFMTETDTQVLSNNLRTYINEDSVIIAAVDFSHGLTNKQAQEKDRITLDLMKNFNYKQLLTLNNDYLDSPPSLVVLLKTMQAVNTTQMELLYNTNSGQIQKNDSIETTSYFSIAYY
jgi:MEMO1 family protein